MFNNASNNSNENSFISKGSNKRKIQSKGLGNIFEKTSNFVK